jgi:hypothetical protein
MRKIFRGLGRSDRQDPVIVAKHYGRKLLDMRRRSIVDEERLSRSCFNVCLAIDSGEFESVTKRASLISDTLLLSHGSTAPYQELDGDVFPVAGLPPQTLLGDPKFGPEMEEWLHMEGNNTTTFYGFHCPDLSALGMWLLQVEPLLKAGICWYLPSYSTKIVRQTEGAYQPMEQGGSVAAVDYIIRSGRLIDPSNSNPVKDRLIRPVLQIDLPFIEGVTLKDFSKITVDEFDSYKGFRNFLRGNFLSMDQALNGEQTQIELTKLRLEIEDQVRAMRAEFCATRRKRTWAATGAVAASTAALLVAVNGSVIEHVLTTLGLTTAGTFWGAITARVENSSRALKSGKWYYVWILSKKSSAL